MAAKVAELYDEDHYAWTRDQATALRRLAVERWNGPLDLEHLAEEITLRKNLVERSLY